jgi:hypothetical protein
MFYALGLVVGGTEGVRSRFHILRARTHFRLYQGNRVPFSYFAPPELFSAVLRSSVPSSCFACPDFFPAVSRTSVPVFIFCAARLVFGGKEGVRSRFHFLRSWARFSRYRGRRVSILCFALLDSFLAVPSASGPVFMFCAPDLVFDGTEGVGSRFLILRSPTHFWRYRGCQVPFSCFRAQTYLRRYRGHRVPFSCFALPGTFSAVRRASVLIFMFCAPGLIFGGTEGVRSSFHILRSRARFRRYRGHWVPFSYFALPESFSAVPRASSLVFHVLCCWTCFRR